MPSSVLPSWLDPGTRKGLVGAAALLWVMTVVAHLPALGGGFIFDDRMYITEDSRMDSLGGLGRIWTELQLEDLQHQYYPMTTSAFGVQHQLWGDGPAAGWPRFRRRPARRAWPASDHYRQALHVAPGFAMAHDNLGAALAMRGELGEAIVHFREACRIDPGCTRARDHLASALEALDAP